MIILNEAQVQALHHKMALQSGGSEGLRDYGLLSSAVASVQAGFGGVEFYPTLEEKAARLGYALVSNHAFVDGNKRIGVLAMLVMLKVNGLELTCHNPDVIKIGLSLADGSMDEPALLQWVREHTKKA